MLYKINFINSMVIFVDNLKRKNAVISHSNALTEARYSLSLGEQKVIFLLISIISPDDVDFQDYEMKVSDFRSIMGIDSHSLYERLNDTLDKLLSRVVHIPTENGFLKIGWISSAEYIRWEGVIRLSFDKKLKPYLLQLKKNFTSYKFFVVTQFRSFYTTRVYMLLKQYETIGKREIDVEDFRAKLGISKEKYPKFKSLRQWVINQAKKEFDSKNGNTEYYNSDINFELETIRRGKKIYRLRFIIKKQVHQKVYLGESFKEKTPAIFLLLEHGLHKTVATRFLEEQGEEAIARCVSLYEEKVKNGKVKDKSGGYLVTMLKAGAGEKNELEKKEEIKKQKRKEYKILAAKNKKREEEENKLGKEFRKQEVEKFLSNLSEEEHEELLTQVKEKYPSIKNSIKNLDSPMCLGFILSKIPNFEERKNIYIKEKMEG